MVLILFSKRKCSPDRDWTKTHGYFIQMGGFVLYEDKILQGTLDPDKMKDLLDKKLIEFPTTTEKEIKDRSKSDGLSKTLVIGQTTWFVIQCIARRLEGLVITELELVTAAFAFLNGIMYFLWWAKPFDVRYPIPVYLCRPLEYSSSPAPERPRQGTSELSIHVELASCAECNTK